MLTYKKENNRVRQEIPVVNSLNRHYSILHLLLEFKLMMEGSSVTVTPTHRQIGLGLSTCLPALILISTPNWNSPIFTRTSHTNDGNSSTQYTPGTKRICHTSTNTTTISNFTSNMTDCVHAFKPTSPEVWDILTEKRNLPGCQRR